MFDLSIPKLLVLAVIALVIFGPHDLPKIASQAGRALRDLRRIAEGARNDLREGLGPEFADFGAITPGRCTAVGERRVLRAGVQRGAGPQATGPGPAADREPAAAGDVLVRPAGRHDRGPDHRPAGRTHHPRRRAQGPREGKRRGRPGAGPAAP